MKILIFALALFSTSKLYSSGYIDMKGLYAEIDSKYALGAGIDAGFFISRNLAFEGYFDYLNFKAEDTMHFGFKVAYYFVRMFSLKAGAGIYNEVNSNTDSNYEMLASLGFLLPVSRKTFFNIEGVFKHLTDKDGAFEDRSYGASAGFMFLL